MTESQATTALPTISRRLLLAATGAGIAVVSLGTARAAAFSSNPFQLGSATGDATEDSVVLWTRLAPQPTASDFGMSGQPSSIPVHWRLAHTYEDVQSDVTSLYYGDAPALQENAWSVHVDVKPSAGGGPLAPNTTYYYQFSMPDGSYKAWIGTTRTTPSAHMDVNPNFAVVSCQSAATTGGTSYWHGYTHLEENPVDFVVHLGDYIYREGHENTVPDRVCRTLTEYRQRWGWYLDRNNIQRVRRMNPMFAVPDDHEIYNNYQGGNIKPRFGEGTDWQLERFNNGLRAYWENMPLRGGPPTLIAGADKTQLDLRRLVKWGANLDLLLLDCRQYRTDPSDPSPSLLGGPQLSATLSRIASSDSTWTVLGTASPLSVYTVPGVGTPSVNWTAYPSEREQITDALRQRYDTDPDFNAVALAGDVHSPFAAKVIRPTDPSSNDFVASEFSTPSMSSYGFDWASRVNANPHVFIWQAQEDDGRPDMAQPQPFKGYLRCTATSGTFYTNFYGTSQTHVTSGSVSSVAKFRTRVGEIGATSY